MPYPQGKPKSAESKAKAAAAMRAWSAKNRKPREVRQCEHCGDDYEMKNGDRPSRRFCGKSCATASRGRGSASGAWKGGRTIHKAHGYVLIRIDGRYVPEHRHVMENHLGRPLENDENVHHINGARDDNRLENLELWSTSQPSGQRVSDKVAWAKELLARYEPEPPR